MRACPVCQASESKGYWQKPGLHLAQCLQCRMVYASPIREELLRGTIYEERSYYLSPEKLQSDYARVRFARELKIFRRFCRVGKVLDVGCSTGAFLWQLKHQFPGAYEVIGTDVAGAALDHVGAQGIPIRREPFLDWKIESMRVKFGVSLGS